MVKLKFINEHVAHQETDVIVNPTSHSFGMDNDISKTIVKTSKNISLMSLFFKSWTISVGEVIVTKGGELKAPYIFNVSCPNWKDLRSCSILFNIYYDILYSCLKKKVRTIAIPVIGVEHGFPVTTAITIMKHAVSEWSSKNDKHNITIYVCYGSNNLNNKYGELMEPCEF